MSYLIRCKFGASTDENDRHGCLYIDREYGCNGEKSRYKLIGFPMDGNWVADPPPQHYYMGPYVGNEALGTETRPEENHHGPCMFQ